MGRPTGSKTANRDGGAARRGGRGHDALAIVAAPGAPAVFATSIAARLPLAMLGLALLVHASGWPAHLPLAVPW
ncbi:MAG: hypothetical protein ACR2JC_02755 [Chloroflexota bacterium]